MTRLFEQFLGNQKHGWPNQGRSHKPVLSFRKPLATILLLALLCGAFVRSGLAAPAVVWAGAFGCSNVLRVTFDVPVSADALISANYTLDQGRSVTWVSQGTDPRTVLLLISPAVQTNVQYVLTIRNIGDLATPPNVLSNQSVACRSQYFPGVMWDTYTITSGNLPNFNSLTPVGGGLAEAFTLGMETRDKWFAVRYRAYLNVTSPGLYTFYTASDDGSRLWIGDTLVVNNDGSHVMREASGTTNLAVGLYPITVGFSQVTAAYGLTVSWKGPGLNKNPIPPEVLFNTQAPFNTPLPTAPSGLLASAVRATRTELLWTEPDTTAKGWVVERSSDLSAWRAIAVLSAGISSYSDDGLAPGSLYYYRVSALNEAGCVPSDVAFAVTLSQLSNALPVILVAPQSQGVNQGRDVTFQVGATGANPLTYQWSKDGTNIAGATNDVFTITGAAPSDEGDYSVTVATVATNVSSAAANLRVNRATQGTTLVWDAAPRTSGVQDGSGVWREGGDGWYAGLGNTGWFDNNIAAFGLHATTNCTVALSGTVAPSEIVFNSGNGGSYTIAGSGVIDMANTPPITANADAVIAAAVSGSEGLVKLGNRTLTLSGANSYRGATLVLAGTLKLGNASALGTAAAGTTVAPGATLDVNGQDLTTVDEEVSVSGAGYGDKGAIINSSSKVGWLERVTLAGDTTLNTANPISIGSTIGQNGVLNLGGFTLTKTGAGQCVINGLQMTGAGNIVVNQGTLRLTAGYQAPEENTSLSGSGTLTVNPGATLAMNPWDSSLTLTMPIVLNGGTLLCDWPTGSFSIGSPIELAALSYFNLNDIYNRDLTFSGVISGAFGFVKQGGNLMRLSATNQYRGPTVVSGGALIVNGLVGSNSVTVKSGGDLGGGGVITGPVVVQAGGKLAPGYDGAGTLTIRNTLNLSGTVSLKASKSGTNLVGGSLIGLSAVVYGGALLVTNTGSVPLSSGDRLTLFAASSYAGSFSSLGLPPLGAGLIWDTSKLAVDGSISVLKITPPQVGAFTRVGDTTFSFILANSVTTHYTVLVSTNLQNWDVLQSGLQSLGSTYYLTDPGAKNSQRRFYRLQFP